MISSKTRWFHDLVPTTLNRSPAAMVELIAPASVPDRVARIVDLGAPISGPIEGTSRRLVRRSHERDDLLHVVALVEQRGGPRDDDDRSPTKAPSLGRHRDVGFGHLRKDVESDLTDRLAAAVADDVHVALG